jgi:hypothetical protein
LCRRYGDKIAGDRWAIEYRYGGGWLNVARLIGILCRGL